MNSIYEEIRIGLHLVWQRRWLALAIAWAISLLGWLAVSTIPNKYESKASVFVQMQSQLSEQFGISATDRQNGIESIQRTLTSAENLEKVVRTTDLAQPGATPRQVADQVVGLRSAIEVANVRDNTFEITAVSGSGGLSNGQNAKLSKDIVQKLLDLFVDGNLAGGRVETAQTLRFLDTQLAEREQQLQEAEAKRVAFEQKYMGSLPGIGSASSRMEASRIEMNQIESSLVAAQGSLAALNGQLASTPASTVTPGQFIGGGGAATSRAAALEGQIADARARGWTDNHPDMISLRSQLGSARAAARSEGSGGFSGSTSTPNAAYVTLRSLQAEKQASASALGARRAQLQAEMAQYQSKLSDEPAVAAEQSRLNRDYEVLKTKYDKLLADREEIKLRGSLQSDTDSITFKVIEPPSSPRSPVAPNRPMLLTLVLLAGLAAGAAAAFGMGQIQTSYPTAGRLERASGLTVIGSITQISSPLQKIVKLKNLKYFGGATGALIGAYALLLVVEFVQRSMVA